jgi:hypothetical protein
MLYVSEGCGVGILSRRGCLSRPFLVYIVLPWVTIVSGVKAR